jgi:hypothetical protein
MLKVPPMQRMQLQSSVLDWLLYRGDRHTLDVRFRTGKMYRYFGVPETCYRELLTAESAGRFFNASIRNQYAYKGLSRQAAPVVLANSLK